MTACGTSAAAPQWAALLATVNEGRAGQNRPALHSAISDIYALPASDFHDITTGTNGFASLIGYDLVTGRGTPKANLIVNGLIAFNEPPLIAPPPVNAPVLSGPVMAAGNKSMAMPGTVLSGEVNPGMQLDTAPPSPQHPTITPSLPSTFVPPATQPVDLAAFLATAGSADEVEHLVNSFFNFGALFSHRNRS